MYTILVIMVALVNLFIVKNVKRGYANISGLFIIVWSICLSLAPLSLYGMNELTEDIKVLSIMPLPIFGFAAVLFPIKKDSVKENKNIIYRQYANNKLLILFNLGIYAYSIPYIAKVAGYIFQGNIYWLRAAAFEGNNIYMSTAVLTIYGTLFRPLLICMIILTAIDYSRGCGKTICLIISIMNVVLYSILFVGRYMIFESLIILFAAFYTKEKHRVLEFVKTHGNIFALAIIGLMFMIYITDSRSNNSLTRSMYVYFCGSFGFLNTLVEHDIGLNLHLYGRAEFGFVYNLIYLLLSLVGIVPRQGSSSYQITQLTGETMRIGTGMSYNSLGTFLHTFMADYGKWGCVYGIIIFAILLNSFERRRFKYSNTFLTAVYLELIFVTINCVLQYSLLSSSVGFLFIYLFLFTRNFKLKSQ